jgi:hypothetical protein
MSEAHLDTEDFKVIEVFHCFWEPCKDPDGNPKEGEVGLTTVVVVPWSRPKKEGQMQLTGKEFAEIKAFIEGGEIAEQHAATTESGGKVSQGEEHIRKLLEHASALRDIIHRLPHLTDIHGEGPMEMKNRHMHCCYCSNLIHRISIDDGGPSDIEGHDDGCAYSQAKKLIGDKAV